MMAVWKVIITIFLLCIIATDANRARRRRQTVLNAAQSANPNPQVEARQQPLSNPQMLNVPGQQQMSQVGGRIPTDNNLGQGQAGRQYGYPGQYGMGSQGSNYYPYGGVGYGSQYGGGVGYGSQYGGGVGYGSQYGGLYGGQYPYGQGMGQYGSSYNQYSGYGSYNRPGYSGGNQGYYPGSGTYGGYFWNAGQKQNANIFTILLSSLLASAICLIAV